MVSSSAHSSPHSPPAPRGVTLLVGTDRGAFVFHRDAAGGWATRGPALLGWSVDSLVALPRARGGVSLLAGTSHLAYGASVRVSDDGGETWAQQLDSPRYAKESGRLTRRIWTLVPAGARQDEDRLYAGVEDVGLFASHDGGGTWRELSGLARHMDRAGWTRAAGALALHSIVPDAWDDRRMWVAVQGGGVLRSEDGGASWQECDLPRVGDSDDERRRTHRLAADPLHPLTFYLQHRLGLFRSRDGCESWSEIGGALPGGGAGFPVCVAPNGDVIVAPLAGAGERYMPGGRLALYRSHDGGETWQPLREGLPEHPQFVSVLRGALAVLPLAEAGAYAVAFGTTAGELFFSADSGDTWEQVPGQLARITTVSLTSAGATS